jgi:hypothetical protein
MTTCLFPKYSEKYSRCRMLYSRPFGISLIVFGDSDPITMEVFQAVCPE